MTDNVTADVTVVGTVTKITYRNDSNGYTVMILDTDSGEELTAVGIVPFTGEGDTLQLVGEMTYHSLYGEQLKIKTATRIIKRTIASVLKYLSGGSIKGIGPATAGKIVEKFGEDSLDIIENDPEQLAVIKGITREKAISIGEEYRRQFGIRDILMLLTPFSVTPEDALKIFRRFGNDSQELIKADPYLFCCEEVGFSFELAEAIADSFGADKTVFDRYKAGIMYVLRKNLANGHTCLPEDKLCAVAAQLLGCEESIVFSAIEKLKESFDIMSAVLDERSFIYITKYYNAERYIAARLLSMIDTADAVDKINDLEIDYVENRLKLKFEGLQREAVLSAGKNGVFIMTGGPGTGKTTTLNAIISIFERRNLDIVLAAPTGRAAKRISELTGRDAKTLHRLLEVEWSDENEQAFCKNEKNPIDCDLLIIDETSMVDVLLFESVLRALRPSCRLILVGDSDQLPSVGAGNILGDLIASNVIPKVALKTVFRQAGKSRIITNAHAVIDGETPDLKNSEGTDFFMLQRNSADSVSETVAQLVTERLPAAYGYSPLENIQVLCPSKKMDTGSVNMNIILQDRLNPKSDNKPEIYYKGGFIRLGDKVMQIKNNYDIVWKRDDGSQGSGVFNGDIGIVEKIDRRAMIFTVRYDDRVAEYSTDEVSQVELAYAVTVHKSQGSEFDCVIIPLYDAPVMLRYRNLLYTAITRAKKHLILVGKSDIFFQMAQNDRKTLRFTGLKHFLEAENENGKLFS